MDYEHGRRGKGAAVHAFSAGGQLCGAGRNTIGTRFSSGVRYTNDVVTCKSCLRRISEREQMGKLAAEMNDVP